MFPEPFALERFFARHEFSARHLLSTSDCQGMSMAELLAGAGDELRDRWEHLRLGYTESQGLPDLRVEIASLYETVIPEEVLVAAPEEVIFLTINAALSPGDHVVCTFPGYQSLYELARSLGCEVSFWYPSESRSWRFDPADLEKQVRPTTKLVVWNFPHNPTGALPSAADYDDMVAIAGRAGALVFSDEMYRLLEPADDLRLPATVDRCERAISLSGMSKAFGLAGLRIGWAVTHERALLSRMCALKDYTTICSSAPSELLALMGLRSRETILPRNRRRVIDNQEAAAAFFARHESGLAWIPPQAGTVCFPRLVSGPGGAGSATSSEAFCARLLRDTGVLLLPSTVYDYGDEHFRLGLGRDDFQTGLCVLDAYLDSRP